MKKINYLRWFLAAATAAALVDQVEAANVNLSNINGTAGNASGTYRLGIGDIVMQNGGGTVEFLNDTIIGGLTGTSGGQISSGTSSSGVQYPTLTINVSANSSYNYSGMWRPNSWDGARVLALDIYKTGEGTQEFSGSTTGYNVSYNTRPQLTVDAGTLIISGSIFHDLTGVGGYFAVANTVTVSGGTLELRNNWDAWTTGAAFNYGSMGPESECLMVNGGTLKFSAVTQSATRGWTVGNNGATIWADTKFTKITDPNFGGKAAIAGSNGGNLTLTGSALDCSFAESVGVAGTWQNTAKLIKNGTGSWTVQGVALNGGVTVNQGTLTISGASTTSGNMTVTGGTLNLGAINSAGNGSIILSGTGIVNVSSAGFTNTATLTGGTLNLNNVSVTSTINLNGGNITNGSGFTGSLIVGNGGVYDAATNLKGTHTYNNGSRLVGNGTIGAVRLNSGAVLAPGNSIGTISMRSLAVQGGSSFNIEIQDPTKLAGVGYDTMNIGGALDLTGLSASNKAKIKLISLNSAGTAGGLASPITVNRNITLMTYGSLTQPTGTNLSDLFTIDTSSLTYNGSLAANSTIYNDSANGQIMLQLSAIPEPSTYGFMIGGVSLLAGLARRRQKKVIGAVA